MRNPLLAHKPKWPHYIIRGGTWDAYAKRTRVFSRWRDHPGVIFAGFGGDGHYGFRLFRTSEKS